MTTTPIRIALSAALLLTIGCASTDLAQHEPLPRHPFPTWVAHLETERTNADEVLLVFGEPAEIEEHRRDEIRWRYALREIHWMPNDPDRPQIAADGTRKPGTKTRRGRARDEATAFGRWIDRTFFFPAARPTKPAARSMPATIHDLELVFDVEGTLQRYRYAPRNERVMLRPARR